jgi:site-specific recombinase XerD
MWTKGKIRRIRIPDILIYESADYFQNVPGNLLFPNRFGDQMTTRGAAADIARWAVKYGVPRDVAHPHAFRHLYAIEFLKVNKDIALLKDLMGHENINTTAGYLTLSEEQQREEFNKAIERQEMHRPDIRIRREAQKKA